MDISLDAIISILTLLLGGSGGAFFTWQYIRKKAKAEAKDAEAIAYKEAQEFYQKVISDANDYRDEQSEYIKELKAERHELRGENDELRKRIDSLDKTVRDLQHEVARNGIKLEAMRPLLCGRAGCADRINVAVSESGEISPARKRKPQKTEENG